MINARAETVFEKPSFRDAFAKRRCLIIADGFYEWRKQGRSGTPFMVCLKSKQPFGIAGLYEKWFSSDGAPVTTCTIITTDANDLIRPIHHRMPVIVPEELRGTWLDPAVCDRNILLSILKPFDSRSMEIHPVHIPGLSEIPEPDKTLLYS